MKTIHEILVLVKKELLKSRDHSYPKLSNYCGLCHVSEAIYLDDIITLTENDLFYSYLDDDPPVKRYSRMYFWKPYLLKPRLKWLTKHINLTKKQ